MIYKILSHESAQLHKWTYNKIY